VPSDDSLIEKEDRPASRRIIEWLSGRDEVDDEWMLDARELVRYAAEHGIQEELVGPLQDELVEYEEAPRSARLRLRKDLVLAYARLAAATSPVNGRTIRETEAAKKGLLSRVLLLTSGLVTVAFVNEMITRLPENAVVWNRSFEGATQFSLYVLEPLTPLLWGAIGSCVFMLMSLYEIAQTQAFDRRRLSGWWMRIGLGAVLAYVVISLFDSSRLTGEIALSTNAIAFLVGLGVKAVYGALEKIVSLTVEKLNLDSLRNTKRLEAKSAIRGFLTRHLTQLSAAGGRDVEVQFLNGLLEDLENEFTEAK
jgi:hypothetical protein